MITGSPTLLQSCRLQDFIIAFQSCPDLRILPEIYTNNAKIYQDLAKIPLAISKVHLNLILDKRPNRGTNTSGNEKAGIRMSSFQHHDIALSNMKWKTGANFCLTSDRQYWIRMARALQNRVHVRTQRYGLVSV